jgi:hypothetical protein
MPWYKQLIRLYIYLLGLLWLVNLNKEKACPYLPHEFFNPVKIASGKRPG